MARCAVNSNSDSDSDSEDQAERAALTLEQEKGYQTAAAGSGGHPNAREEGGERVTEQTLPPTWPYPSYDHV